jgi:hypothetical protein
MVYWAMHTTHRTITCHACATPLPSPQPRVKGEVGWYCPPCYAVLALASPVRNPLPVMTIAALALAAGLEYPVENVPLEVPYAR